jgi:type III restriction enzyme
MNLAVDQPILNSPFEEPTRYWIYERETRQPVVMAGRRPAGYYFRARRRTDERQLSFLAEEQFVQLELVNTIRHRVGEWRGAGYSGVTPITRQLLGHWGRPERERKLFFCQREAAETVIWLTEIDAVARRGLQIPQDRPFDEASLARGYKPLTRYGLKMATGSGKTVVMAMLIAWSILNKVHNPQDRRFSDAILVVCPNLTVRERLGGTLSKPDEERAPGEEPQRALIPGARGNYYQAFDLVPNSLVDMLGQGRIFITNWHAFAPEDDSRSRGVVQRGPESDKAFASRVLRDLGSKKNILVLNDEAHHAHRPAPYDAEAGADYLSAEEKRQLKAEKEQATVWVTGLDRIHAARSISFCVDLSATPFYIQGSGYEEGSPFPWLVSDFGLVDAIESGIVKIPRVPVADDTGQPIPKYFRLWEAINQALPPKERATARRKPKPEAVVREAEGALQQLAGEWKRKFEEWEKQGYHVPPAMIAVCDNTNIARLLYEFIAEQGRVFPELLQNQPGQDVTLRIDSKLLEEAEGATEGVSRQQAAESLRRKVASVGKPGEPGEGVRCVISVGMLTEGWDAHNVTQILGLRAFQSQLLCEQVVGRGLRRINYDDFSLEEYVDVYGIPFEVIPVKKKPSGPSPPGKETTLVQALKEREVQFKLEFPRVEKLVFEVRDRIQVDIDRVEPVTVEPSKEPTEVIARARVGYQTGAPSLAGPGEPVVQTRAEFYDSVRTQQIQYEIARRVTDALVSSKEFQYRARHLLYPQVLQAVRAYLERRVAYGAADRREIGLEKYVQLIVERLTTAILPEDAGREAALLPVIERFRPRGSTSEVLFRTVRPCRETIKSHISHVVLDTKTWESSAAFYLETSPLVQAYARNDHLDFTIPYEYAGTQHDFLPDFLVRLNDGTALILEVKGQETEQDRAKYEAARRWAKAVTYWGQMGRWTFEVCKEPPMLKSLLAKVVEAGA